MPTRRRNPAPLVAKLTDVWFAAPQVMALRLSRMAAAGHSPSVADRAEMHRMGSEKVLAFSQSWLAMWMDWWLMPLRLAPAFALALGGGSRSRSRLRQATTRASTALLTAGVLPVHRTVVANSKRLAGQGRSRSR